MCRAGNRAQNEGVRSTRATVWAGVCIGAATLAEIGAVVLGSGSTACCQNVLFRLNSVVIVAIGVLTAIRRPGHPVGWILAGFGTFNAITGDLAGVYGHRASIEGW